MRRVLFLAINARYVHSNLAVRYLRESIKHICPESLIIERGINESCEKIMADIRAEKPDVIAISVYIWNTVRVKQLIPLIREELPGVVIVLGGPDAGYNPGAWSGTVHAPDYIVAGAGEAGFARLAASGFRLEEKVIREKNPPLGLIPFPYNAQDMENLSGRFIYYESSRGCPFRCSYCISSREDQRLDLRPVNMVCDEIEFLSSFKPGLVKFVDRTFNSRKEHYRPVWEHIVKKCRAGNTVFHFEVFPGLLDADDLDFLSSVPAGLFQFEIGLQSFTGAALEAVHRVMDRNTCTVIEKIIAGGNIHVHLDLIAGLPFEDYAGFANSFNRVMMLKPDHFQPGILKVLPGTEIMERAVEYGLVYSQEPPYTVWQTAWLRRGEMERITAIAGLVERLYNSGKFRSTESWLSTRYDSSFGFYEKLAAFCDGTRSPMNHWEDAASMLIGFMRAESSESVPLLMDHLRWDWCVSGTVHHYPEVLRSELTIHAKRTGYNYLEGRSEENIVCIDSVSIKKDELRRSIFFVPETEEFREKTMKGDMAVFLPDKRRIFFNIHNFIK